MIQTDTFDMIQNALEEIENNLDKATSGLQGEKWNRVSARRRRKCVKCVISWNGAAYKAVKQDLKNSKDLDNICSKGVLGKGIKWFAET